MRVAVFASFCCAALAGPVCGQEIISLNKLPSGAALSLNQSDRSLLAKADSDRKSIELSLQNTLVAFDTRMDGGRKKVGLVVPTFSDLPLELAYDPTGKSMMAQWRSVYTTAAGQAFQYQAFVGESGAIHFVISSKF